MPHLRERHCLPICLKKLKFSRVLAIQGMRQTGKSILVSELLAAKLPQLHYTTLDKPSDRAFANSNPESFIARYADHKLLAIDEAQKAPALFDTIKMTVDKKRRPGMFILLGSTEFSKMTLIRESLTGRMSRVRVFPLNLAEANQLKSNPSKMLIFANEKPRLSRGQLLKYLNNGGMPGIFAIRENSERILQLEDWLALTCERDLHQIPKVSLNSDLARRLLEAIARTEEPTAGNLANHVGETLSRTKLHLDALSTLFVIQPLLPHSSGRGKALYFLGDVGFASYLGASFGRLMQTWVLQEISSQIANRGEPGSRLYYYRGSRGGIIDLLIERRTSLCGIKILSTEQLDERDLQGLIALKKKIPTLKAYALGGLRAHLNDIEIHPWEAIG